MQSNSMAIACRKSKYNSSGPPPTDDKDEKEDEEDEMPPRVELNDINKRKSLWSLPILDSDSQGVHRERGVVYIGTR